MRDPRRLRNPDELRQAGEILEGLMERLGLGERLKDYEIVRDWPRLVGDEIAKRSRALRVRDGILYVRVDSAAWSQELFFMKARILERIAEVHGCGRIHDLRLSLR